jgi:serine/threonine-protein kinase HipA
MIKVWTDHHLAGFLDRYESRGSTFYMIRARSLRAPFLSPWNILSGLAPIFEMNIQVRIIKRPGRLGEGEPQPFPESAFRLAIVGRSQMGRIRYTGAEDELDQAVPFESVDEILPAAAAASSTVI